MRAGAELLVTQSQGGAGWGSTEGRNEELELWVAGELGAGSGAALLERVWVAPTWLVLLRAPGRGWEQLVPGAGAPPGPGCA